MKRTKIFLASLAVVLALGLIGVWGLFFAGKLSILADLVTPSTTTEPGTNVVKTVSPTPAEVVKNGFDSTKDAIKVNLDIKGLGLDTVVDKPVDMVAVLDVTNSMNDQVTGSQTTKIAALKSTFKNLTNLFAEKNVGRSADKTLQLGMVAFNSEMPATAKTPNHDPLNPNLHVQFFDLTTDYATLNTDAQGLTGAGNTNMGEGLQAGYDVLNNLKTKDPGRYNNSVKIVILLSDGMHNTGVDPTANIVLNSYRSNNVPIYTIGFGDYTNADPENVVDAALDMSDKSNLWCKDKSAPYLVNLPALPGDLPRYYCLAKDLSNPGPHQLGYRLNALAIETKGQYFYAPNAATLDSAFGKIFQTITITTSAISAVENFDSNYNFDANQTIVAKGPNGGLTKVDSLDKLNVVNQYFVKATGDNQVTFIISKGTIVQGQTVQISFNLKAKITDQDTCIDKTSYVRWGKTIDYGTFNVADADKLQQEALPEYCYNLKTLSPNNPPENPATPSTTITSSLLQTGVSILMLAIISIVLIAAIFYILALIKEK